MRNMRAVVIMLALLAGAQPARADTLVVRPDGTGDFPTIQMAVEAATEGDVILLAGGTFTGPGNRDVDFLGKTITVRSLSGYPASCIVDCEQAGRGFVFHSGESRLATLERVTIRGGLSTAGGGGFDPSRGGGIYIAGASPTIRGCTIVQNTATGSGGGVYCRDGAAPLISGCVVSENATLSGSVAGGIFATNSSPEIRHSTISANLSGGVSCEDGSTLIVEDCTITGNVAVNGGGFFCGSSTVVIAGSTFAGNRADSGGGIFCADLASIEMERSIVWGNCALLDGDGIVTAGSGGIEALCCALDPLGVGGTAAVVYLGDQVFADPVFCGPEPRESAPSDAGNYALHVISPCLPESSPCGELIGALPLGCGVTSSGETSWSALKALY